VVDPDAPVQPGAAPGQSGAADDGLSELRGTANAMPVPGGRPLSAIGKPGRARGFDASEGTDKDPLKNKTFDLTNPKSVPNLKQP